VNRDEVAEIAHASEGNARDFEFGDRGLQAGAPRGYAWCQQREISEQAAANGKRIDFLRANYLADFGFCRLDDGSLGGDDHLLGGGGDFQCDVDCG
jgi:hypothetical protein